MKVILQKLIQPTWVLPVLPGQSYHFIYFGLIYGVHQVLVRMSIPVGKLKPIVFKVFSLFGNAHTGNELIRLGEDFPSADIKIPMLFKSQLDTSFVAVL